MAKQRGIKVANQLILKEGNYPESPGGPNVVTRVLKVEKEGRGGQSDVVCEGLVKNNKRSSFKMESELPSQRNYLAHLTPQTFGLCKLGKITF